MPSCLLGPPHGGRRLSWDTGSCSEDPRVCSYSSSGPTELQLEQTQVNKSKSHTCSQLSALLSGGPEPDIWLPVTPLLFQGGWQKALSGAWHPGGPDREPLTPTAGMGVREESLYHSGPGQQLLSELLPPRVPFLDKGEGPF